MPYSAARERARSPSGVGWPYPFPIASTTRTRIADRATLNSIPARRIIAAALRASRNVRHRFATIQGATRTATTSVDQPSHSTPRAIPAAVPPVPSGTTIVSGGASSCEPSSSAARKCPITARGSAPPPANKNSRPRTLLPPLLSSRLSQSARSPSARASAGCASSGAGQVPRLHGAKPLRIFVANTAERSMQVTTDYIRHAARAARKCAGDPLGGAPQAPDPEFYRTLAKALEQIAAGMEALGKQE